MPETCLDMPCIDTAWLLDFPAPEWVWDGVFPDKATLLVSEELSHDAPIFSELCWTFCIFWSCFELETPWNEYWCAQCQCLAIWGKSPHVEKLLSMTTEYLLICCICFAFLQASLVPPRKKHHIACYDKIRSCVCCCSCYVVAVSMDVLLNGVFGSHGYVVKWLQYWLVIGSGWGSNPGGSRILSEHPGGCRKGCMFASHNGHTGVATPVFQEW